jgi:phospholipid N-methyltransferase
MQVFDNYSKLDSYYMNPKIKEFKEFVTEIKNQPQSIGAVMPSGDRLADLITEQASLESARTIVEIGPGTGVFTKRIVKKVPKNATYFAIELNEAFATALEEQFPDVPVYQDSAEHINKYLRLHDKEHCDRIISGLPWTAFEKSQQSKLLDALHDSLEDGGLFLTFSYFPLNNLPKGRTFKKMLLERFSDVARTDVVPNVPPAFVYVCKK